MKRILYFLLLNVSCVLYAQEYIPILQEGNEWGIDYGTDQGTFSTPFSIDGEEIINGISYKTFYGCKFREENGLLIYLDDDTDEEVIMLDFNLEIGDNFEIHQNNDCLNNFGGDSYFIEVIDVTSMFIAGMERKIIETDNYTGFGSIEYWIEGIGSTSGLTAGFGVIDASRYLVCFTNDGETTFFNEATMCDNTSLGLEDLDANKSSFAPNPVVNTSILYLSEGNSVDTLIIYDLNGRLVIKDAISINQYQLKNTDLKSGMYIYHVIGNGKIINSNRLLIK